MNTNNPNQKRKIVFIDHTFQGRFVAWVLATIVVAGVCSATFLYFLLTSELKSSSMAVHVQISEIWQRLGLSILVGTVIAGIIGSIAATVVVLRRSHKIAGPLYRFRNLCKEIERGNFSLSPTLREDDQLQELSNAFRSMISELQARRDANKTTLDKAKEIVAKLRQTQTVEGQGNLLDQVDGQLETLRSNL